MYMKFKKEKNIFQGKNTYHKKKKPKNIIFKGKQIDMDMENTTTEPPG